MIKVLVNGAAGFMGGEMIKIISAADDMSLAAGVDTAAGYPALADVAEKVDVAVDFSHHTAVPALTAWALKTKTPLVIATTGHDDAERELIFAAAREIPVFYAANMSMGIALMADTVTSLARAFPDADVEIVEKHHVRKVDAPSGTALMLFDAVKAARPDAKAVCGRSGMGKRERNDVGIASLRMGNLVGEHEVIFTTPTQSITLKHEAYTRALFAEGAAAAARFIADKPAGLYGMRDLLAK